MCSKYHELARELDLRVKTHTYVLWEHTLGILFRKGWVLAMRPHTQCELWLQPLTSSSLLLHLGSLPPWHHITTCTPVWPNWVINTCSFWQTKFPLPAEPSRHQREKPREFHVSRQEASFLISPGHLETGGHAYFWDCPALSLISREARHFHWVQAPALLSLACALSPGGKAQIAHKVVPPEIAPSSLSDLLRCPTQTCPCTVTREAQPDGCNVCRGSKLTYLRADGVPGLSHPWKDKAGQFGSPSPQEQSLASSTQGPQPLFPFPSTSDSHPATLATASWLLRPQGLAGEYTQHHSRCQWP